MKLNEEQRNLLCALEHGSRRAAVQDLLQILPHVDDDLKAICAETIRRLEQMSDEEFLALDLTIPEEGEDE